MLVSILLSVLVGTEAGQAEQREEPPIRVEAIGKLADDALAAAFLEFSDMNAKQRSTRMTVAQAEHGLLPPEHGDTSWAVTIQGKGLFGEGGLVWNREQRDLRIRVWPEAFLVSDVSLSDQAVAPTLVRVRIELPAGSDERPYEEVIDCPVTKGKLRCAIPCARMNLTLRVPGYASVRLWDVVPEPGREVDARALSFVPGPAVSGFVKALERNGPPCVGCRVTVLLPRAGSDSSVEAGPGGTKTVGAYTDSRGYFQVRRLAPGVLPFRVDAAGYAPHRDQVRLIGEQESELVEPIVLRRSSEVRIRIRPDLGPDGRPWQVQLLELRGDSYIKFASSMVTRDKPLVAQCATGVEYALEVKSAAGATWLFEPEVKFGQGVTERTVDLRIISIEGQVTIGDRPLRAEIRLAARDGGASVPFRSDDEGRFVASLPPGKDWIAQVKSESPKVVRTVPLETCCSDGSFVEIVIPGDGRVSGRIVDERNEPVPEAIVRFVRQERDGEAQSLEVHGGRFELHGLAAGQYYLSAEGSRSGSQQVLQSREVTVLVREADEEATDPVTLVLKDSRSFLGRVVARSTGASLSGVRVERSFPSLLTGSVPAVTTSDSEGRFEVEIPVDAPRACLFFSGPGVPSQLIGLSGTESGREIPLDDVGGLLVVEIVETRQPPSRPTWPLLVRDDCRIMPLQLGRGTERPAESGGVARVHTALVADGQWTLCSFDQKGLLGWPTVKPGPGSCLTGVVSAGQRLELSRVID